MSKTNVFNPVAQCVAISVEYSFSTDDTAQARQLLKGIKCTVSKGSGSQRYEMRVKFKNRSDEREIVKRLPYKHTWTSDPHSWDDVKVYTARFRKQRQ